MASTSNLLPIAAARAILREARLRCTAARVAVVQQMAAASGPLSHNDVVDQLSAFGFDQSTIYRSLNELAEAGILSRLDLGDQIRRFEFRSPTNTTQELDHPHFMCVTCGKIMCLSDFSFQLTPLKKRNVTKLGPISEVLIKGFCPECV